MLDAALPRVRVTVYNSQKGVTNMRFYASIQGNRGEATRMGGKESGIRGHIRGWEVGARVYAYVNGKGEDEVRIYLTSGSNSRKVDKLIGTYSAKDLDNG